MNEKPKEKTYYYWRNKCIQKEIQIEEFIKKVQKRCNKEIDVDNNIKIWRVFKIIQEEFGEEILK